MYEYVCDIYYICMHMYYMLCVCLYNAHDNCGQLQLINY